MGLYDADFHAWARAQADAIRRRSANEIDWEHLAQEVDSLGDQQQTQLFNRFVVLIAHLLKWERQPDRRSGSWRGSIREQRKRIDRLLRKNPSLKAVWREEFVDAYDTARTIASDETGVPEDDFPDAPAFTLEEALDPAWPEDLVGWEPPGAPRR